MADEGSSIWGAGDAGDNNLAIEGQNDSKKPEAPRLFDDFGDAGWGSPEVDEQPLEDKADPVLAISEGEGIVADVDLALDAEGSKESAYEAAAESLPSDSFGFDDFQDGTGGNKAEDDDDDFGDFGEFDEQDATTAFDDQQEAIEEAPLAASSSSSTWRPLHITPNSNESSLQDDIRQLLSAPLSDGRVYPFHDGAASQLSQERIRQVEGPSQVLAREESRQVWSALTEEPNFKPIDWTRSKTRRQYLIAIGVPINLDELNASASNGAGGSKQLPPLALKLDDHGPATGGDGKQRPGSAGPNARWAKERAPSKPPEFDAEQAKALVAFTEDQLTLQALPALRNLQREAETLTKQASTVLTHFLAQRESHRMDAETYNGLIRDLVTGAAKRVSAANLNASGAGGGMAMAKRGSGVRIASSASGRNSPALAANAGRSASPRT